MESETIGFQVLLERKAAFEMNHVEIFFMSQVVLTPPKYHTQFGYT